MNGQRRLIRIISGGQTGADREGLDAATALGFATGGQAPSGYWTERGPDPSLERLGLVAAGSVESRTVANVLAGDATVIFGTDRPGSGSALTRALALRYGKPVIVIDPWAPGATDALVEFVLAHDPGVLNVAGHRESQAPGIHGRVFDLMTTALERIRAGTE